MENLKKYRLDRKISVKKITTYLNVARATYYNYETGRTEPDIKTLIKLSKLLNISIDDLVGNSSAEGISLTNKELDILAKSAEVIQDIVKKVRK
jgi:repressor LexA